MAQLWFCRSKATSLEINVSSLPCGSSRQARAQTCCRDTSVDQDEGAGKDQAVSWRRSGCKEIASTQAETPAPAQNVSKRRAVTTRAGHVPAWDGIMPLGEEPV